MRRYMFIEHVASRRTGLLVSGPRDDPQAGFRVLGVPAEIRVPNGSVYHTTIISFPLGTPPLELSRPGHAFLVLAHPDGEVTPGSEVWLPSTPAA
jgi:hypothetical protein